jgi:putative endonuclease
MKSYWVYMVLCDDGSYYIGITHDVEKRIWQHNEGTDPRSYTFTRRPVTLAHAMEFLEVDRAISWEKQIKRWSRRKKAALAAGNFVDLQRLARSPKRVT